MKLIKSKLNICLGKYEKTYLADTEDELTADFDPNCAEGSIILVISTEATYMKNTKGQWQKCGTTEVVT